MTLTVRSASTTTATTKGAALTHAEMDANWLHLAQSENVEFVQSGTGAIAEPVQDALQRMPHSAQYDTAGNFNTSKAALTGTIGLPSVASLGLDVTKTGGTVATGSVELTEVEATFTGDSGGGSDVMGLQVRTTSDGGNAVSQLIAGRFIARSTGAGAVTTLRGLLAEARLDGAGDVGTAIGLSASIILTSTGSLTTNAQIIRVAAPTITGTGTIPAIDGIRISNQGHAKVTDVFGIRVEDQSSATGAMYGFRGELTAGTGKWNFYASGNALNFFNGDVLIGSSTDDGTNKLQVTGTCVSYSDTLVGSEGGSFKAANNTTKAKFTQIGYDGTADVGYIKAIHAGTANKNLVVGVGAAVATTATYGMLMIGSCAGTPTGVPTGTAAGRIAMIYDTTADKIWFYNGAWRGVAVT